MKTKHVSNIRSLNIGVVLATTALALAPSFALADTLIYETGFELPTFLLGPLDGQDEWMTAWGSASISDENPESGDQSVEVPGADLFDWGDILWTHTGRFYRYDTIANGTSVIEEIVDAQLEGPSTDTGQGTADDLFSANLSAAALGDPLGSLVLSSSGEVWIFGSRHGDDYVVGVPIDLQEYHRLGMRIDFSARTHQFFVDGDLVATLPISPSITTNIFNGSGFVVGSVNDPELIDPSEYTAYFDNFSVKAYMPIPFDVEPYSCPSTLNVESRSVLPVAILGTETFDVSEIDPASIRLVTSQGEEGISPLRWSIEDVATPYEPYIGKESAEDCNDFGPDGYIDLTLKFDKQAIVEELDVVNGQQIKLFTVTGELKKEFENTPIIGEDIVVVESKRSSKPNRPNADLFYPEANE